MCISPSLLLLRQNAHPSLFTGTWPYSYDSCDLGTLPNQTYDGTPAAAATGGLDGGPLSYQPGQRLSSCTCPNQDHPGPATSGGYVGRGVPEIDILEAQIDLTSSPFQGQVSQSLQVAPYNYQYQFNNASPATTINDSAITTLNTYKGAVYQQALSAVTDVDSQNYGGNNYATYGFEYWANPSNRPSGYITWYSQSAQTWKVTSASIGPDSISEVSSRLIPEEPMVSSWIIVRMWVRLMFGSLLSSTWACLVSRFSRGSMTELLNTSSASFQGQDYHSLTFPNAMYVDYVRLYQREGLQNALTCDPPGYPTAAYINSCVVLGVNRVVPSNLSAF